MSTASGAVLLGERGVKIQPKVCSMRAVESWPTVGREAECDAIVQRVRGGVRTVLVGDAVAVQLRISPRGVQVHLLRAYQELGINSRRELPGALAAS